MMVGKSRKAGTAGRTGKDKVETKNVRGGSKSLANANVTGRSGKAGTAGRTGKDKVETKNVRGGSKAGGVTRLPAGSKSSESKRSRKAAEAAPEVELEKVELEKVEHEESEYEKERHERIMRNKQIMDTLGIGSALQAVAAANFSAAKAVTPAKRSLYLYLRGRPAHPNGSLSEIRLESRGVTIDRLAGRAAAVATPLELIDIDLKEERRIWDEEELIERARKNQGGDKSANMLNVKSRPSPLPTYIDLLTRKALAYGDRVFLTMRKEKRFYGDLLADGQIRYSAGQTPALDLTFPSPTAFNNFCGKLADPSYYKGNGFIYVYHRPPDATHWLPIDYYRWVTFGRSQIVYPRGFVPGNDFPGNVFGIAALEES